LNSPATVDTPDSERDEGRQKAVADQVGRRSGDDQLVIVLAEASGPRRCRHSDERDVARVFHPPEDFAVKLMRFVHDDDVDIRALAPGNCLDRADLHRLLAVGSLMDPLHDAKAGNPLGLERATV
jgi:hypothetical protein